ncbi:MAG: c-type cytochrome [Steroidobacteraceae bacterium]
MKSNALRGALALLLIAAAGAATVQAQESAPPAGHADRGAKLAYTCLGCHGIPNYKNTYPMYRVPKLKGQHVDYLVIALQSYRSGERAHATMHAHASSMSDQDMADIAAYLSGTAAAATPNAPGRGTPPAKVELCKTCHGNDGIGITPQYPTIGGQYPDYISRALHEYKKGGRKNPIMAGFAGQLTEAEIEELAEYYGSQAPSLATPVKRTSLLSSR